jgi:hypothetical protein
MKEEKMKVDCLYVNGCSWTYGSDLEHCVSPSSDQYRIDNSWATILGKLLGLEVINGSAPGAGNDRILRTATKDITNLILQGRRPLIVIAWSSLQRFELPEGGIPGTWRSFVSPGAYSNKIGNIIFKNWSNDHSDLIRWLQAIILLDCLAKLHNLPYFSTCVFSTNWPILLKYTDHLDINSYFKTLQHQVGINQHRLDVSLIKLIKAKELPFSQYLHPLEDGHRFIAQWVKQSLEETGQI